MTKAGDFVETPHGELDYIVGPDGEQIKLGLLPSNNLDRGKFATFSSVGSWQLSEQQIRDRLTSKQRKLARELFGPEWIKDQDGRGACQGYASASCQERTRKANGQEHVKLSGDWSYALVNGGRDQGSALSAGLLAGMKHGYCPESFPGLQRWEYRIRKMPSGAYEVAKRYLGIRGFKVKTELELASALCLGMFAVVAVHAGGGYGSMDRYGISRGGNGRGNHAVCIDDVIYDTQAGRFKFDQPNSWKTRWADGGRIYLSWNGQLRTTVKYHDFYVFPSAIHDPQSALVDPIFER